MKTKKIPTQNARAYLIFAIMAIIALLPKDLSAASKSSLVGSWQSSQIAPNGAIIVLRYEFTTIGSGSFTAHVNNQLAQVESFAWEVDDDVVCMNIVNKRRLCLDIDFVNKTVLTLRSPEGKATFLRIGQPSFGSSRTYPCNVGSCWCRGYEAKSSTNSVCKNCNHSENAHDK